MTNAPVYNKITIVDEHDVVIGAEDMLVAIENGLLRSGVRIFIFSHSGKLLLQRRSEHVRHPGQWDMAASGHVDEGETRAEAAYRELAEETGIIDIQLMEVDPAYAAPGTINGVYRAAVPDETELSFDPQEVQELRWVDMAELECMLEDANADCSLALKDTWQDLKANLINTQS